MLRVDEIEADNEEEEGGGGGGKTEKRFLGTRVSFLGGMTRKKRKGKGDRAKRKRKKTEGKKVFRMARDSQIRK